MKNRNNFDKKLDKAWLSLHKEKTPRFDVREHLSSTFLLKMFVLIIVVLLSFKSNASYCLLETPEGNLRIDSSSVESCTSGLILLSKTEYDAVNAESIVSTLIDLFEFSVEDFALFNAICLIGFISGHALGRVSRILGKT